MPRKRATDTIEDVVIGAPRGQQNSHTFIIGLVVSGIVIVGASVLIGRSDSGPINVVATIQESNEIAAAEGGEQVQATPPIFQSMPNGGLVAGQEEQVTPPAPEPVDESASSTATTTETVTNADDRTSIESTDGTEASEETTETTTE